MTLEERIAHIDTMSREELEQHHKALFNAMMPERMRKSLISHCEKRMESIPSHSPMVEMGELDDCGGE